MARSTVTTENLKSHLTKEELAKRKSKEDQLKLLARDKIKPPKWLSKDAEKIFRDIVKQLSVVDILANLDVMGLAILSDAFEKFIKATMQLNDEELTTEYTNKNGSANSVENPLIRIQIKYAEVIKKYSVDFGLSPASRLKLIQENIESTDEEEENFKSIFGDV